jgi:hypothetical protein
LGILEEFCNLLFEEKDVPLNTHLSKVSLMGLANAWKGLGVLFQLRHCCNHLGLLRDGYYNQLMQTQAGLKVEGGENQVYFNLNTLYSNPKQPTVRV